MDRRQPHTRVEVLAYRVKRRKDIKDQTYKALTAADGTYVIKGFPKSVLLRKGYKSRWTPGWPAEKVFFPCKQANFLQPFIRYRSSSRQGRELYRQWGRLD